MKKSAYTISLLAIFCITFHLLAESKTGQNQKIYLEANYGQSFYYNNSDLSRFSDDYFSDKNTVSDIPGKIGAKTYYYGSNEDRLRNYYLGTHAPKAKLKSNNFEFLFGYFLNNRNSIGLLINSDQLLASNVAYINSPFGYMAATGYNYIATGMIDTATNRSALIEGLFPFYRRDNIRVTNINTFNAFYSFHFLESKDFEPFIMFGFGAGKDTSFAKTIYRTFITLGNRILFSDNAYSTLEITGNNYDAIHQTNDGRNHYSWNLIDTAIKVGFGFRI